MTRKELQSGEYNSYYDHYLNLVPESASIDTILQSSLEDTIRFINKIDKPFDTTYATGKWSIGEVLMHNIDTERVFAYRALRFMRGDQTPLPGFDQDVFAQDYSNYAFAKADLINSFKATRNATIDLFKSITAKQLISRGVASESPMSVRVIPFLIAGHNKHHENVIRERYLS
ncbi:hypothetical protein BST92_11275 [Nonlabens arenilitoris]|uniref:DinB-like domain-containing protein n=1 Tax=Nonlabens arenilitoris TaxID=1217969 RepID=A0A2S7UE28_9FLAO|nr:DinB family protein [Nonlabens arenilitoris]PQJ32472.1 hypothetical protein BST92_11275 [Nonlabens arenilitoris]